MAKKILIVEDEKILAGLLEKRLSQDGYNVFTTKDGVEGLEVMRKNSFDLILLDIIMPRMGGFEMMEEKLKDERIKDIPIIIISNSGQPVEIDRARKLGAKDWLIKTEFNLQEVLEKVIKQIGK